MTLRCHPRTRSSVDSVKKHDIDLLFLDIQMPELSGLDFLKALTDPPNVILTTAYSQYALDGFELDVTDYLLKPIQMPRLLRAIDKVRRMKQANSTAGGTESTKSPVLAVPIGRQTVTLPLDDVHYIESMGDYVKIYANGRPLISKQRISDLAERLSRHGFLRIHRSFVVALDRVTSYSAEDLRLKDDVLPISRSYRQDVLDRLSARDV